MNQILLRNNRQLIPRWHTSRKAFRLQYPSQEINNDVQINPDGFRIEDSLDNWRKKRTTHSAVDLFTRLKLINKTDIPEFTESLEHLRQNSAALTPTLQNIISPTLRYVDRNEPYTTSKQEIFNIIGVLKQQVKLYPEDTLTWMDLAFYYTIIGESKKAEKSATIGFYLASKHPFIARSYSRFLVHYGRAEEALFALKKTDLTKSHPLIASAWLSICTAFNLGNPDANTARKILKNYKGHPVMLSDLAASLGTIEIKNGAIKKGIKLLSTSLLHPSENSIAQCTWLHHKHDIQIARIEPIATKSLESKATDYYVNRQFKECSRTLMDLYSFQPFSEAPIIDAGYISIVGARDPQFVIDISENRIPITQMSFGELNNLIVAKIQLGQKEQLSPDVKLLRDKLYEENERSIGTFLATFGMFQIACGAIEDGCLAYESAIKRFKAAKDERGIATAQLFYAEQLSSINAEEVPGLLASSIELAKKNKLHEVVSGVIQLQTSPRLSRDPIEPNSVSALIHQSRLRIPKDIN